MCTGTSLLSLTSSSNGFRFGPDHDRPQGLFESALPNPPHPIHIDSQVDCSSTDSVLTSHGGPSK